MKNIADKKKQTKGFQLFQNVMKRENILRKSLKKCLYNKTSGIKNLTPRMLNNIA